MAERGNGGTAEMQNGRTEMWGLAEMPTPKFASASEGDTFAKLIRHPKEAKEAE